MNAIETITDLMDAMPMDARPVAGDVPRTLSVVLASDGSEASAAAFSAARLIEDRTGASVHVLSVLEPLSFYIPVSELMLATPELEEDRTDAQHKLVAGQMAEFSREGKWTLDVKYGRPAEVIAQFATESAADLIIIGSNKHGMMDRIRGEETAMEVARLSQTPLLVASPDMKRVPQRVIVAMELLPSGVERLPDTLRAIADTPSISCVHVKPRFEFMGTDWAKYDSGYEIAMEDRFAQMEKSLAPSGLRPDLVVLHGDVAGELADFAEYSKAELIAVGIKRRRGRARAVGGRLACRILRRVACSVLIVPNECYGLKDATMEEKAMTDVIRDSGSWSKVLKTFTERNAGRIVTLEVDDPDIGAMVEARSYPLLGVDYDHKDGRITIMLGDSGAGGEHLTRGIPNPSSVSVLTENGRDTALSIGHGEGQTLLTI